MTAKITLTLTQEDHGSDDAMAQTVGLLTQIGVAPTKKVVLTVECEPEDVESYADDMDAALSGRPTGIEVVIRTVVDRHVERRKLAAVTPMDEAIERLRPKAGDGVDYVEISSGDRSARLEPR